jgi:hypothetical protein
MFSILFKECQAVKLAHFAAKGGVWCGSVVVWCVVCWCVGPVVVTVIWWCGGVMGGGVVQ